MQSMNIFWNDEPKMMVKMAASYMTSIKKHAAMAGSSPKLPSESRRPGIHLVM